MLKVLVVEDEVEIQKLITVFLSSIAACDVAKDGLEGVNKFNASLKSGDHYDLIILDILMPYLDGGSALKKIRQLEKERNVRPANKIKVIILTVLDKNHSVADYFKDICDGYVIKPFDQEDLIKAVKSLEFPPFKL